MKKYKNAMPDELSFSSITNDASDSEIVSHLRQAMKKKTNITGYCLKCDTEGNLEIHFSPKIIGIVPRDEVTYRLQEDGRVHLGKTRSRVGLNIAFKVKEIKKEGDAIKAILSRKDAVLEIRDKYFKEIKVGMVVRGVVVGMQDYGAFIDIGGDVTGIMSVADISRSFVHHPMHVLKIGQVMDVVVRSINPEKHEIGFSRKELLPPWADVHNRFKKGETVLGTVKGLIDTGIFIGLDECYEGMAEFVHGRKVKTGDKVRVTIIYIDDAREKIKLKME